MSWFVGHTKFRSEFKALDCFEKMGLESYVPYLIEKRQWSDRIKKVKNPAITGYVFFRISKICFDTINSNPFVKRVVRNNGAIVVIKDEEIDELKSALSSYSMYNPIKKGNSVLIENGVFKHRKGVVESINKNDITILINKLIVKLSLKETRVTVAV